MKTKADMAIAYFGTPRFAVWVFEELAGAGIVPNLIVTQPDRPAGRGLALTAPPVKEWGALGDIPVLQDDLAALHNSEIDLFIVAAYGRILTPDLLSIPTRGTLNVHPSLLPRFRGPSPVESQICADERECGVTIIELDAEMDHGPILAQASVTPDPWPVRASVLKELLAREGGKLLAEIIPPYMEGGITPEPQDHARATYTSKMKKEDGFLDLSADGYQNYLKFCAYDEWPGTYFFVKRDGKDIRVKITDAEYKNSAFVPLKVIPEGKKEMLYANFMHN